MVSLEVGAAGTSGHRLHGAGLPGYDCCDEIDDYCCCYSKAWQRPGGNRQQSYCQVLSVVVSRIRVPVTAVDSSWRTSWAVIDRRVVWIAAVVVEVMRRN